MIVTHRCTGNKPVARTAIAFQESRYGVNKRVANSVPGGPPVMAVCTICGDKTEAR